MTSSTWLYNPGDPHAADARATAQGNVPKYYRLTCEPFNVGIHPLEQETRVHFGPTDTILKKVSDEFPLGARFSGFTGHPEWWECPLGRQKQINWTYVTDTLTPTEEWERVNPGKDWRDWYPHAQWWLRPGTHLIEGARWVVIAHLWADPGTHIPRIVMGGAAVDYHFPWGTSLWSPFGKNELYAAGDPAEGPKVQVEAYWP